MKKIFILCVIVFSVFSVNAEESAVLESVLLQDIPVKDAAALISEATDNPIVVSRAASEILVHLRLKNVTSESLIDSLCRASGLWAQKDDRTGITFIQTLEEFKGSLKFGGKETIKVIPILYPAAGDIADVLAQLFINRVIWNKPPNNSGDAYSKIGKSLRRMDLLNDRSFIDIASESKKSAPVTNETEEVKELRGDDKRRVDTDTTKRLQNLSREEIQTVASDSSKIFRNDPGLVYISVLPESNSLMLRSADAHVIDQFVSVIEKLDRPVSQVLLEVKILSVKLEDNASSGVDMLFSSNDGEWSGGWSNGLLNSGSNGQEISKPNENLVPQGSGLSDSAAIFNFVGKNVHARVQMLEKDGRLTRLATPNLIVSDNESSLLFIGDEVTVMEKAQQTVTYTQVSADVSQPNISWSIDAPRREIGLTLMLIPKIHADRTVTLRLLQEKSALGDERKNVFSGGTQTSGSSDQYFYSQDITMQRVVSTVEGKDQEFMVIGGLVSEGVQKDVEKIPLVGDIPWVSDLFNRKDNRRERKETLILIRPFVMMAPGENSAITRDYLERLSQHPSARSGIPSLGVNSVEEIARPRVVNPDDPWLVQQIEKLTWGVDAERRFDAFDEQKRKIRGQHHREAILEIENLQNKEPVK